MNEAKFRKLRKKAFFIGMGLALAGPVIASQNENCPDCLIPSSQPFFKTLVSLQAPVFSALDRLPRNNVASIVTRHQTPYQPIVMPQAGPVVDPTDFPLPGAFDPASVNPNFESKYWNWNPPTPLELPIWNPIPAQVFIP